MLQKSRHKYACLPFSNACLSAEVHKITLLYDRFALQVYCWIWKATRGPVHTSNLRNRTSCTEVKHFLFGVNALV